jgi:cell division septal protein FtsQ
MVVTALQENPKRMPAAAKSVPMKAPELKTMRDGVLDNPWLARTLELPSGVSLMELNLEKIRARVLTDQQVLTVNITRHFPDRLVVQITERMPIARIRVEIGGVQRDLLVARDGVVFFGTGYDPAMLKTMPWLDGIALAREGVGFRPIANMNVVAQLLADAQFSAPHLYETWQSVSLARLEMDRELEVTTKSGTRALFTAKSGYFVQLANFDHVLEQLKRLPGARAHVDLTLGREVPVTIEPMASTDMRSATRSSSAPFSVFPISQSKNKREL